MNFSFTEDQVMVRDSARAFLAEASDSAKVRAAMDLDQGWDATLWSRIGTGLGWTGISIPEAYGGSGMGYVALAIVMEEMGRTLCVSPFFASVVLAAEAILQAGTEAQKQALLPGIASGETTATLCFTGAEGKPGQDGVDAVLTASGNGFRLSGEASFVPFGHAADLLVVAARHGDGLSLAVVSATTPGVEIERLSVLDTTRPLASVRFSSVALQADAVLGVPGAAGGAFDKTLSVAAAMLAAEQVGGAEKCLEMTVEYSKTRTQFGRIIGSFQAVKHSLADMMVLVEASKSIAYYAACAIGEIEEEAAEAASMARAYCSDALYRCAADAIQLHGGIGFTWEHDAHLYFKRARASANLLGDPTYHREIVAQAMGLDTPSPAPVERS